MTDKEKDAQLLLTMNRLASLKRQTKPSQILIDRYNAEIDQLMAELSIKVHIPVFKY